MALRLTNNCLTVAGLIEALQRQMEIDPSRADLPAIVCPAGERSRYWVSVATDAGTGPDEHVMLIGIRQR